MNSEEHLKPKAGMIFDTLTNVVKFHKSYAHDLVFVFVLVSKKRRRKTRKYYSRGIIVQGKAIVRRTNKC
jgi:hypothetical protein